MSRPAPAASRLQFAPPVSLLARVGEGLLYFPVVLDETDSRQISLIPRKPPVLQGPKYDAQSAQVSNGAFGNPWPHASGPQQRVPTSVSVSLVLTNRTPPPFFAGSSGMTNSSSSGSPKRIPDLTSTLWLPMVPVPWQKWIMHKAAGPVSTVSAPGANSNWRRLNNSLPLGLPYTRHSSWKPPSLTSGSTPGRRRFFSTM